MKDALHPYYPAVYTITLPYPSSHFTIILGHACDSCKWLLSFCWDGVGVSVLYIASWKVWASWAKRHWSTTSCSVLLLLFLRSWRKSMTWWRKCGPHPGTPPQTKVSPRSELIGSNWYLSWEIRRTAWHMRVTCNPYVALRNINTDSNGKTDFLNHHELNPYRRPTIYTVLVCTCQKETKRKNANETWTAQVVSKHVRTVL